MIFNIVEKCLTKNNNTGEEYFALRTYQYDSKSNNILEAKKEIDEYFDSSRILSNSCNDEFDGECLNSEVIKIEKAF